MSTAPWARPPWMARGTSPSATRAPAPLHPTTRPIYFKGRFSTDPAGTMPQGEYVIVDATTSKTGNERWGDYAGIGIDPTDDCTFWFTTEYGGSGQTKVAAFKFDGCGGTTYSISGTVSGATSVTMNLTGASSASTTTDGSRQLHLLRLMNGSYTVTPSKSGYTFAPTSTAVTISGANQTGKNFTATAVPTYSITGTVSGDTTSGVTMSLTGTSSGTTTTATGGTYTFSNLMNGSYTVTPSKVGYSFSPTSIAVTISGANQTGKNFTATAGCFPQTAVYSSTNHCPTCTTAGLSCVADTSLLSCRGTTGEANAPNTIDGCADGNSGSCHSDESIESITVTAADGSSCLSPGQSVTVQISAYCYSNADYITLFYSTNASTPSWTKVGSTQQATGSGTKTFMWTMTLSGTAGSSQALRAQMTYNADPGTAACASGNYNDRDDLVFAVGGSTPTTYSISGTVSGSTASGVTMSLTGAATATTTTDTSGNYTFSGLANGSYTVTPSKSGYAFSPTSTAVTISGANQTGKNFTATSTATYSISGTVSGATASGVTMSLTGAATATTTTDTSGNYTFSGLANGSYTVTPSKSGYAFSPTSTAVTISGANQTGKNFTATSTATYSISGTVSGATASGVTMSLTGAATGSTTTDTSGNYTFSGLCQRQLHRDAEQEWLHLLAHEPRGHHQWRQPDGQKLHRHGSERRHALDERRRSDRLRGPEGLQLLHHRGSLRRHEPHRDPHRSQRRHRPLREQQSDPPHDDHLLRALLQRRDHQRVSVLHDSHGGHLVHRGLRLRGRQLHRHRHRDHRQRHLQHLRYGERRHRFGCDHESHGRGHCDHDNGHLG